MRLAYISVGVWPIRTEPHFLGDYFRMGGDSAITQRWESIIPLLGQVEPPRNPSRVAGN